MQTVKPAVDLSAGVPQPSASIPPLNRWRLPYAYRVPLCVPFWNHATYLAWLRCCLSGRAVTGPDVEQLERRLAAYFATFSVVASGSGRAALELALRATGVGGGDEVIVPTFCCASIIPPIVAIGAVPVLADVGEQLMLTAESVAAACTPRTRAVVVAHLFGNPAPIDGIVTLCRERRIILIDDAAQALGARHNGQLLGTFGDAGVISFGAGKVCFGVGGGAVVSRHAAVLAHARSVRLGHERTGEIVKHVGAVLLWRRWRRWTLPLRMLRVRRRSDMGREPEYRAHAMPNISAATAASLLKTLDYNLAARRARVAAYQRHLANDDRLKLIPHGDGSACLTQVVRLRGGATAVASAMHALRRAGYEVDRSYQPLHLRAQYAGYARTTDYRIDRLWPALLELPCEPSVHLRDVARIAQILLRSL